MKCHFARLAVIVVLAVTGCGGGESGTGGTAGTGGTSGGAGTVESAPPAEETPEDSNAFPESKATASITGKILFDGDPPAREEISAEQIAASKDKCCADHHKDSPLLSEDLIVSEDKTIRNVLVSVKSFPGEWTHATPTETVTINQVKCAYVPHVVGLMTNQPVVVTSDDDTTHNVHFMAKMNRVRKGNLSIPKGGKMELTLKRPELGSAYLKCDIHGWMKCHLGVFDHPFFTVTGDGGSFELGKLPPGEYEIEAWHETLGTQQQKVTLKDGEAATLDFTFSS